MYIDKIIKEEKGRYRVLFDTGVSCVLYNSEMCRFHLQENTAISDDLYEQIFEECLNKRAKKRAMYLLEKMDRTEQQLRDKLKDNSYPPVCIDEAIAYVKRYHYLDDARYARHFIEGYQSRLSRQQIKQKLSQKGIHRDLIEQAFEEVYEADEMNQIQQWVDKKKAVYDLSERKDVQKLYRFLLRRGFRGSDIQKAINCQNCTNDCAFDID